MSSLNSFETLFVEINKSAKALTIDQARPLGLACPPNTAGVYALFYQGVLQYIGQASGNRGLLNRRNNYISGDNSHTTHRVFLGEFPDKPKRRRHIAESVLMAWHCVESGSLAKAIERALIWQFPPHGIAIER